ncbi:MAG: hypothetical protein Q4A83_01020 [Bacillota bacterium]|nr:hypothetical protein [Bacillota bacterium]
MTVRERPGIYAEYRVNSSFTAADDSVTVGVAAHINGDASSAKSIVSYMDAVESYGICPMTKLIKTLFLNGCGRILAVPVIGENYPDAYARLLDGGADIIICDSRSEDDLLTMKSALENGEYAMGIWECDETADRCVEYARDMNFERLIICAGADEAQGNLAAALAGVISSEKELFLNGHALSGVGNLVRSFTEREIEDLIAGGVTPIENDGESVCVVRGVTTKTNTDGIEDKSLREIATVITVQEVLKSVHSALKLKFARAKNDALTRGAIRSQVAVELEKKLAAGKIADYGNIRAVADTNDISLCRVDFEFSVVCGLNTIMLTAYLNV